MKHSRTILCGLLCLTLGTAGMQAARPDSPVITESKDTKHTTEYITTRLQLIYALAFNSIETGHSAVSDYFFSDEFRALYKTAEELTPDGEMGYYDFNPWVRSRTYSTPGADIVKVHDITMKSAVADVAVYPTGEKEKGFNVRVRLRFEHGDWFISNFNNDLAGLQRYISNLR